jgi:hypothetical protein
MAASYLCVDTRVDRNGKWRLSMTIVYLIAAAVVICGCVFFVRARSGD